MRKRAKTDDNHQEIINAFRKAGCSVLSLHQLGSGTPDILVYIPHHDEYLLVEIKDGKKCPSQRRLTPDQIEFHASWKGRIEIVESLADVVALL